MVQTAHPNADVTLGDWTDEGGGTTDIFESIDEATPNDSDYITTPVAPEEEAYVCALGTLEDPLVNTGHVVHYRYRKSAPDGAQIDLTVELREGYTDEGSPGTLIASQTHENIPGGDFTTGTISLNSTQADSITDYSDLFLRFVADQPSDE